MKLLFAYDFEMLTILQYLRLISSELPLTKYPLATNIIKIFARSKTPTRCYLLKNASYAIHLSSLASIEKLRSFRKLISQEQNILFQEDQTKLQQFLKILTIATLAAAILNAVAKDYAQAITAIYNVILAIACSYIIYHANKALLQIEKFEVYKKLVKLAEFQD